MEEKKPELTPFGKSSGINVGPFNVRLCGPVVDKVRDLEICGPDVEIKFRDPNEMILDLFKGADCNPQCGVFCSPDGRGICAPAIMSGDIITSVINPIINPILERQREIDGKIEKIMESIRNIENKIK